MEIKKKNNLKSRGFITIATGHEKYHKMAYVLLKSYRNTTANPERFAVITDKKSRYTAAFDDIVLVKDATKTYMDKIDLLINLPYDETIFIDADCIAYNDLNYYWKAFENSTDMSAFGRIMDLNSEEGWYNKDKLGKLKSKVDYCQDFHGGIYYFRKSKVLNKIYQYCMEISKNYSEYQFKGFQKPADEPIFALAMAATNCKATKSEYKYFAWLRRVKKLKVDFFEKKLSYTVENKRIDDGMLLHFGTSHTILPLYLIESKKVLHFDKYKEKWGITKKIKNYISAYVNGCGLLIKHAWKLFNKRNNI